MIILITVSSGTTSLISLNINIYGYIYLTYNCRLPVLPAEGLLPSAVKDALRTLAIGPWPGGSAEQTCEQEQAGPSQWLEGVPWPVARDKTSLGSLKQASVDRQLHRRERKLSAARSPPPHALLDDPAHQHLAVHVPRDSPLLDNPAYQLVAVHLPATPHGPRSSSARGRTGWWGQSLVPVGTRGCLQSLGVEGGGGGKGKGSSPNLFVLQGLGTAGDWALC